MSYVRKNQPSKLSFINKTISKFNNPYTNKVKITTHDKVNYLYGVDR